MSDPLTRAQAVYRAAQELNAAVREQRDSITHGQASSIVHLCRETEDWLLGVRRLLEVE